MDIFYWFLEKKIVIICRMRGSDDRTSGMNKEKLEAGRCPRVGRVNATYSTMKRETLAVICEVNREMSAWGEMYFTRISKFPLRDVEAGHKNVQGLRVGNG